MTEKDLDLFEVVKFNDLVIRIVVVDVAGIRPFCDKILKFLFCGGAIGANEFHYKNAFSRPVDLNIIHDKVRIVR